MASLDMLGPHQLDNKTIDNIISEKMGNYALGYLDDEKTFIVKYVGRDDVDLNCRLKVHANNGKYKLFKYAYATSAKAAFEKESKNYHDFGGKESLDNKIHPDRPDGSGWKCPSCNVFD